MNTRNVKISKFLSLVLRHQPETVGLKLDEAGWVSVAELLAACGKHGLNFSLEELQQVVATNDKKRFAFSEDGLLIRASQGHSVEVELGYDPVTPPGTLFLFMARRNASLPQSKRKAWSKAAAGTFTCQRTRKAPATSANDMAAPLC